MVVVDDIALYFTTSQLLWLRYMYGYAYIKISSRMMLVIFCGVNQMDVALILNWTLCLFWMLSLFILDIADYCGYYLCLFGILLITEDITLLIGDITDN